MSFVVLLNCPALLSRLPSHNPLLFPPSISLSPSLLQISTLVSHEERGSGALVPSPSCRAVARVGVAVNLAVERFVTVGESIAEGNPEVREEMYDACKEARAAGKSGSPP
ncbi:hypothetical protein J437_LFUL002743 [Ladona fulva]|uniref:Alpha-catulin n=1 Tax=Ladona fulva TaxID=123851 RepID=A0A8K0K2A5_LADFU|nr:hypothetical protein J437_LFUL002743 [Ladona fulva]